MSTQTLQDKVALITGAGGGLGRALAEHFLLVGARVVAVDINAELLTDFETKTSSAHGNSTLTKVCDVTDDAALDSLFEDIEQKFGRLDCAVNCAGIMDRFDPAGDVDRKVWDRVIAINLTAPTMISKRAVNLMLKHGTKGSIVNIASVAAFRGFASGVAYTVSKHGLLGLTKNTAAFYRTQGIRCNAVAAGSMPTNIANEAMATNAINLAGIGVMNQSLSQLSDPANLIDLKQMAKLVAYLSSDDAKLINGAMVTADGGATSI